MFVSLTAGVEDSWRRFTGQPEASFQVTHTHSHTHTHTHTPTHTLTHTGIVTAVIMEPGDGHGSTLTCICADAELHFVVQ